MKTYKNILPLRFFNRLKDIVHDKWTPWYFHNRTGESEIHKEPSHNFMFTHLLAKAEPIDEPLQIQSDKYTIFEPIVYFIDEHVRVNKILRMKLNLYTNQNKIINHFPHRDYDEKDKEITTSIFNFTTCNGGTTINNKFYKSQENELHIFNSECLHYGRVQDDTQTRIVLNINWI